MKELKFSYDSKVQVVGINNPDRVEHLNAFIGLTGEIISYIRMNSEITKYKVLFDDNEQHYFFEDELIEVK